MHTQAGVVCFFMPPDTQINNFLETNFWPYLPVGHFGGRERARASHFIHSLAFISFHSFLFCFFQEGRTNSSGQSNDCKTVHPPTSWLSAGSSSLANRWQYLWYTTIPLPFLFGPRYSRFVGYYKLLSLFIFHQTYLLFNRPPPMLIFVNFQNVLFLGNQHDEGRTV